MYLTQIRYGFATNSSSSHSVILAEHIQSDSRIPQGFEYGWDEFVLASTQAKRDYLFVQSRKAFADGPDWEEFVALVGPSPELLVPVEKWWRPGEYEIPGYVDHESEGLVYARTIDAVKEVLSWLDRSGWCY